MTTPGSGEGTPINDDSPASAPEAGSGSTGFAPPGGAPSGASSGVPSGAPSGVPAGSQEGVGNGQQAPQYGQPQYGQPQYGQQPGGQPQYGQPQGGQPQYGQYAPPSQSAPSGGQPQYGQPQGGQPQYGQQAPQYGQQPGGQQAPQYGQPQNGQPQYNQYGQPQFGGQQPYQNFATVNKPGIIPLRPLSLGEIYDGMFGALRRAPGVVLGLVSAVVAVFVAVAVLLGYVIAPWISSTAFGREWNDAMGSIEGLESAYAIPSLSIQLLISLVVPVATVFTTAIVVVAIGQLIINRPVKAGETWIKVSSRFWALCGVFLVVSVLAPAVVFAAMALLIWGGFLIGEGVGILFTVVAFIVGGLFYFYIQMRWIFAPITLVLEERTVFDSIKRSGALVKGSFWRIVGYYLLTSIALSFILGFVTGVAQVIIEMAAGGAFTDAWWGIVGYALLQTVVMTLTVGALSAVITLLYVDIRMRREALDLELIAAAENTK